MSFSSDRLAAWNRKKHPLEQNHPVDDEYDEHEVNLVEEISNSE